MNRTGLAVALAVAVVVGVVFGVYPQLDLDLAQLFFNPKTHLFRMSADSWEMHSRDAARWIIIALTAPAFFAIVGKVILPRRRMLISGRAALFVLATLTLGPGILTNGALKQYWGRSRPIDVVKFEGTDRFTPWWDPRGQCPANCSFVAGEPSGAFWTLAPAVLAPPQWRPLAYGAALVFGAAIGLLRMAAGGHFFSDIAFAGVLMFLVVWALHGLIYRWRPTRLTDKAIEQPLARAGDALRGAGAALWQRIGGRADKR